MKAKVITLDNKDSGEIALSAEIFGLPLRKDILHRVVNWQLAKRQQGTHNTKIRSEVVGGKKKPHKQKGTGQARQGSTVSSHHRGGGIAFGPRPRSHEHSLNKKIRALGLKTALSSKVANGSLIVIKDEKLAQPKASILAKNLKGLGVKSALIICGEQVDLNFRNAAANIMNIDVLPTMGANVYDILRRENLILTESAVKKLEERLA